MKNRLLSVVVITLVVLGLIVTSIGCAAPAPAPTSAPAPKPAPAPAPTAAPAPKPAPTSAPAPKPAAAKVTLRFNIHSGPTENITKSLVEMADTITKRSEGELEIKAYVGGVLGKSGDNFDLVSTGTIDMCNIYVQGVSPSLIPLNAIFDAPFFLGTPNEMNNAIAKVMGDVYSKQFAAKGIKTIRMYSTPSPGAIASKKSLAKLADFKGMNAVAQTPALARVWGALDSTPCSMGYYDAPMALQKGVADACQMSLFNIMALKYYDVTKYWMDAPWMTAPVAFGVSMNLDRWNSLSKKVQDIILDEANKHYERYLGLENEALKATEPTLKEKGMTKVVTTSEELEKIRAKLEPLRQKILASNLGPGSEGMVKAIEAIK